MFKFSIILSCFVFLWHFDGFIRLQSDGYSLFYRRNFVCRKMLNGNAHQALTGGQFLRLNAKKVYQFQTFFRKTCFEERNCICNEDLNINAIKNCMNACRVIQEAIWACVY